MKTLKDFPGASNHTSCGLLVLREMSYRLIKVYQAGIRGGKQEGLELGPPPDKKMKIIIV